MTILDDNPIKSAKNTAKTLAKKKKTEDKPYYLPFSTVVNI